MTNLISRKVTYNNPAFEKMSEEEMKEHQFFLLIDQLKYICRNSEYYSNLFKQHDIKISGIRTFEDYFNLPIFLDKERERISQNESLEKWGHPFGIHLCSSPDDIVFTGTTSGTSGQPTFTYTFTQQDLHFMNQFISHMLSYGRVMKGDRVLFAHALGIYATSSIIQGIKYHGALPIDVDIRNGSESIINYARLTKPTALMTTPSLAEYLIEKYREIYDRPISDLGIQAIFTVGEVGIGIPEVKNRIEKEFGCRVYDYLGEIGFSCDSDEYHGVHCSSPELGTFPNELIDPHTLEPLEISDGVIGEIVITEFHLKALPRIRYRSGDLVQVFTAPCPGCGFTGRRVKMIGRSDDMIIVKGTNVYPTAIKEVITEFMPDVTGEMRIVLNNPPPRIVPPLLIKIEHRKGITKQELDKLDRAIKRTLHERLRVTPEFEWVQAGSIDRSLHKTPVFEKRYEEGMQ
ncbi:phenylacetate-CoA ligase [Sporosarcina newyorkensis 2681]|uniref:Phenylacetate-CoA ligase n=1 Tax=Sporosarcina newyorkensis 2681 TaxID=1027292 RepID=F9DQ30_9BACL|nr:AMP-binding protein [Sporosarcina newyorkensis]EGQ27223.1 phenylacetate-CoA ligase [Sporosarcina newyorkensis 2681]